MEINEILVAIEQDINRVKYKSTPKNLYEPIDYTLERGGKRVRPLLVGLVYLLFKKDFSKVLPLCRAVEVFHNFTLLHDDIMEKGNWGMELEFVI